MLKSSFLAIVLTMSFSTISCTALTQNHAETRPDHPDHSLRTRSYAKSTNMLFQKVLEVIKQLSQWETLQSDPERSVIQATRTTRLFRFVDDIQIQITEKSAQEVEINLRSASRVGKGDFGQNARNIRLLLKKLDQSLTAMP